MVRLQKFLSEAGVASRRASEKLIAEGRVTVNGRVQQELGAKVDPVADTVALDGKVLKLKRKLYIALNKPPGYVCSKQDEEGRKLIGELLPAEWTNLYSVGRLDRESEGLIFLTNDGDFSLKLTHPRYGIRKIYVVGVAGKLDDTHTTRLLQGVEHEGEILKAQRAVILGVSNAHSVIELELTEGKNREVRRMFEVLQFEVERLQRVQIGPIKLGDLRQGRWRTLNETEVRTLTSGEPQAPKPSVPSAPVARTARVGFAPQRPARAPFQSAAPSRPFQSRPQKPWAKAPASTEADTPPRRPFGRPAPKSQEEPRAAWRRPRAEFDSRPETGVRPRPARPGSAEGKPTHGPGKPAFASTRPNRRPNPAYAPGERPAHAPRKPAFGSPKPISERPRPEFEKGRPRRAFDRQDRPQFGQNTSQRPARKPGSNPFSKFAKAEAPQSGNRPPRPARPSKPTSQRPGNNSRPW